MKKTAAFLLITAFMLLSSACSDIGSESSVLSREPSGGVSDISTDTASAPGFNSVNSGTASVSDNKILIAYFTRLDNTSADLDEIIRGGGPYGSLGSSFANADVDAVASASIVVKGNEVKGNTQTIAEMICNLTGGDLFSIKTIEDYPANYSDLIDKGGVEKNKNARPELSESVENMESYDIVFIGFPNWWNDMPMTVYSFLEEYDFSGKTVIPFATSAGSGLSRTVNSIRNLLPNSRILDGIHIPMRNVPNAETNIKEWLNNLDIL